MTSKSLAERLAPCGPVVDKAGAERAHEVLSAAASEGGWADLLARAWPALGPVFAAAPYLAGLARRSPERLRLLLQDDPARRLNAILAGAAKVAEATVDEAKPALRRLKAELHLLTALCDLGGVWDLDMATGALARFADASLSAALAAAARAEIARGRLAAPADASAGPVPGLFCLALGKHGAYELNYSSDIDISFFYEPEALPVVGVEPHVVALAVTQSVAGLLQDRTADGYVFRVDLRLRPDPSSTPAALPVEAALVYYETVGQNWERAAMIKGRAAAGDVPRGEAFLAELQPFIWRKTLDFASIADIHSIKRQIHAHKVDERLTPQGANLKLGRGGIREVEFYVQTQQLILGGRDPSLRSPRTLDALEALAAAGHVTPQAANDMREGYRTLRDLEHRVQMLADEQTHILPEDDAQRRRVAALSGYSDLRRFDAGGIL